MDCSEDGLNNRLIEDIPVDKTEDKGNPVPIVEVYKSFNCDHVLPNLHASEANKTFSGTKVNDDDENHPKEWMDIETDENYPEEYMGY